MQNTSGEKQIALWVKALARLQENRIQFRAQNEVENRPEHCVRDLLLSDHTEPEQKHMRLCVIYPQMYATNLLYDIALSSNT